MRMGKGVFGFENPLAKKVGFTSDKFDGWLGKKGRYIYISFIVSKHPNQGNFSKLCQRILGEGYGIKVPTPFAGMMAICVTHGFHRIFEHDKRMGRCEVWKKEPNTIWKVETK